MDTFRMGYNYGAFGSRLKAARENAGYTQAQACEAVGIPKAQVLSSYERGISNPPVDILASLARLYGVTVDSLLYDSEDIQRGSMTIKAWMEVFVQASDELHIAIEDAKTASPDSAQYSVTGLLTWGQDSVYRDFFSRWVKLRAALKDGLIDEVDYHHLVNRHIDHIDNDPDYDGALQQIKSRLGI